MRNDDTVPPGFPADLAPGDVLDTKAAAALLRVQTRTMENWRWAGVGPRAIKVGARCVRYLRADLLAFLASGDSAFRQSATIGAAERIRNADEHSQPSPKAAVQPSELSSRIRE